MVTQKLRDKPALTRKIKLYPGSFVEDMRAAGKL